MSNNYGKEFSSLIEVLRNENSTLRQIIQEKNSVMDDMKAEIERYHESQKSLTSKLGEECQQMKFGNEVLRDAITVLEEKKLKQFLIESRDDAETLSADNSRKNENLKSFHKESKSKMSPEQRKIVLPDQLRETESCPNENVLIASESETVMQEASNNADFVLKNFANQMLANKKLLSENEELKANLKLAEYKSANEIKSLTFKLNVLNSEMSEKNSYIEKLNNKFLTCMNEYKVFEKKFESCKMRESQIAFLLAAEKTINDELNDKISKLQLQENIMKEKITRLEYDLNNAAVEYSETKNREMVLSEIVDELEIEKEQLQTANEKALQEQLETERRRKQEEMIFKDQEACLKTRVTYNVKKAANLKNILFEKQKYLKILEEKCRKQNDDIGFLCNQLDKKEECSNSKRQIWKQKRPNNFQA